MTGWFPGTDERSAVSGFRRRPKDVSALSRRHELLILCARIGFNP